MKKPDFSSIAAAVLFVLSLVYLGAETIVNMSLLDIAGSVRSKAEDIDRIQRFGRAVSAFGCYLLVVGLFVRDKFSLAPRRQRLIFILTGFLSFIPFAMIVAGVPPLVSHNEIFFAMMPFLGALLFFVSFRYRRFALPLVLFLMVWSSVYVGQKILIEEALVDRTGWEERVNARYVLMLRSGFEDCTISLDDLKLCDTEGRQDIVKSARVILGALWMLNPEGIRRDMIENREKIIHAIAASGIGGSLTDSYQKYLDGILAEREKYKKEMIDKYYKPYQEASALYVQSADMSEVENRARAQAAEVERKVEQGWRSYSEALQEYRRATATITAAKNLSPWQEKLKNFCAGKRCPQFINKDPSAIISQAEMTAESRFVSATGYPASIDSYEAFMAHPKTQDMIRKGVDNFIQQKMGVKDFSLPYNWRYDREGLVALAQSLAAVQVNAKWREKFRDIPPGLAAEDFFTALGYPPLPEVEELAMSQQKFFDTVMLPEYKRKAVEIFDKIESEKHLYANGAKQEAQGREYVRAAYIPAISLVISLMVVTITILRWLSVGIGILIPWSGLQMSSRACHGIVAVFVLGLLALPYLAPNAYISGKGYQRYLQGAEQGSPVFAAVLDWALHAQPLIYRFGIPIRKMVD